MKRKTILIVSLCVFPIILLLTMLGHTIFKVESTYGLLFRPGENQTKLLLGGLATPYRETAAELKHRLYGYKGKGISGNDLTWDEYQAMAKGEDWKTRPEAQGSFYWGNPFKKSAWAQENPVIWSLFAVIVQLLIFIPLIFNTEKEDNESDEEQQKQKWKYVGILIGGVIGEYVLIMGLLFLLAFKVLPNIRIEEGKYPKFIGERYGIGGTIEQREKAKYGTH